MHLAKNGEEEIDLIVPPQEDHVPQNVSDIDTQALTNQWISASKMIPGSFVVLGKNLGELRQMLMWYHYL